MESKRRQKEHHGGYNAQLIVASEDGTPEPITVSVVRTVQLLTGGCENWRPTCPVLGIQIELVPC
jgi:hypothetical protein